MISEQNLANAIAKFIKSKGSMDKDNNVWLFKNDLIDIKKK